MAKGIAGELVCVCGSRLCQVCNPPCCKCLEKEQANNYQTVETSVRLDNILIKTEQWYVKWYDELPPLCAVEIEQICADS